MSIIKFFNNANQQPGDLTKKIAYVGDYKSTQGVVRGVGTGNINPCLAMELVRLAHKKTENRQYIHFAYSPDPNLEISQNDLYDISYQICRAAFSEYQVFYGIHTNTNHIHTHFIINTVSYKDGRMFQQSRKQLIDLKKVVLEIEIAYGLIVDRCSIEEVTDDEDLEWLSFCDHEEIESDENYDENNISLEFPNSDILHNTLVQSEFTYIPFGTGESNLRDVLCDESTNYKPFYSMPLIVKTSAEPTSFISFVENKEPREFIEFIDESTFNAIQVSKKGRVIGVIYKEDKNDV